MCKQFYTICWFSPRNRIVFIATPDTAANAGPRRKCVPRRESGFSAAIRRFLRELREMSCILKMFVA